jgi:phosphoserine phosphatase
MVMYSANNEQKGIKDIYDCRCAVFDIERTLLDTSVSEGVGKRAIEKELRYALDVSGKNKSFSERLMHVYNVLYGMLNYLEVKRLLNTKGEIVAMQHFFNVLGKVRCVKREEAYEYAQKHVRKHALPDAREFVTFMKDLTQDRVLLTTLGSDLTSSAAGEYFGVPAVSWNNIVYENDRIVGCDINVDDADKRLASTNREIVDRWGVGIDKCLVVGDEMSDVSSMRAAKLSAASPLAIDAVKKVATFSIEDYKGFVNAIAAEALRLG